MKKNYPSLIDFWRIRRKQRGEICQVQDFHRLIAEKFTKLVIGTLGKPNLMILMPPRCAKTDLVMKTGIAWAMSYFPDSEFISSSYGQDLATDTAIDIRDTLASDWYRSMIDSQWGAKVKMSGERAGGRQDHFYTLEKGAVKGVGRGGPATGFGAGKLREEFGGFIGIDDPLKALEGKSPAARKEAIEHIRGTLYSRRNRQDSPSTPVVLVMQRLHPEDPAGILLREERDEWEVVQIPAHEGEKVIWPGRKSYAALMKMLDTDPETYWSQEMQQPSQNDKRKILKGKWWRYWSNKQALERMIQAKIITADTAFEEKQSADWSVFQCWGMISTSAMVLMDQWRGQWEFPELMKFGKAFIKKHATPGHGITPARRFYIENRASGISLVQMFKRDGISGVVAWAPKDETSKDKVGRAKQMAIPLSEGRIYLPDPTSPHAWSAPPGEKPVNFVEAYKGEADAFSDDDSHLWDDQVDTGTCAASIWREQGGGTGPLLIALP